MKTIRDQLLRVVSDVLDISADKVSDDSGPATLDGWGSAAHLSLVLAIEAEFDISLSDEEVMDMISVGQILHILRQKGIEDDF